MAAGAEHPDGSWSGDGSSRPAPSYGRRRERGSTAIGEERLRELAEALFPSDRDGRLDGCAPDFHVVRSEAGVVCRTHRSLPRVSAEALLAIAARARGRPVAWAEDYAAYVGILAASAPVASIRAGHLSAFPLGRAVGFDTVVLTPFDAGLLAGGLDEWLPDIASGLPAVAVVREGRAVSVCASVRTTAAVHFAGVETLPDHRSRGCGAAAVRAWADEVRRRGAEPFYGTTFDNVASQKLAQRCGLRVVASEFSIAGGRGPALPPRISDGG